MKRKLEPCSTIVVPDRSSPGIAPETDIHLLHGYHATVLIEVECHAAAMWSGNQAKETVGELPGAVEEILDRHEDLAETARNFAIVVGGLALVGAFVSLKGAFRHGQQSRQPSCL